MDIISFKNKIENPPNGRSAYYIRQYNDFWAWKIHIEQYGNSHILDAEHIDVTCQRLLDILPKWQTYRGIKCDYEKDLPIALGDISDAYSQIRQYSLLEFQEIPEGQLLFIWHALGRVKERCGIKRADSDYFLISVCKPLMFLWGQTLAFDSINRINIRNDRSFEFTHTPPSRSRWSFSCWKSVMQDLQRQLLKSQDIVDYCKSYSYEIFGSNSLVPFGRYLDLFYYY